MKSILKLILLSLCLSATLKSQVPTYTVLTPKQHYLVPNEGAVVLTAINFGEYHYISEQYDTLKQKTTELEHIVKQQDSLNYKVIKEYDSLILLKDNNITDYKTANSSLEIIGSVCATEKKQLQTDYIKLEQKNNRTKRWRNFFMGTSFCFGAIISLAILH